MLTREEARKKECPYRAAGLWANSNPNMSAVDGALNCRADDCPKWVDAFEYNGASKTRPSDRCIEMQSGCSTGQECLHCPYRYGHCGG